MVPLFHHNLFGFRPPKTVLNPLAYGKIQEFFKAFEHFSSTFQGKFYFQGLLQDSTVFQVLFKPVRTLSILRKILPKNL